MDMGARGVSVRIGIVPMSATDKAALATGAAEIRKAESESKGKLDGTLGAATKKIVALHNEIEGTFRAAYDGASKVSLSKAIEIGRLLTGIRSGKKQGRWLQWVKENLPFKQRQAWNYMQCYKERDDPKLATVANLKGWSRALPAPKKKRRNNKIVEELVSKGIARDERAARTVLKERREQDKEPEPQLSKEPKGWTPSVLEKGDLTPDESETVSRLETYATDMPEGRRKAFKRYLCESDIL
jgi:hypothetical protein